MVSQAGILPTPNSPGIQNGDISSYIKRSYYPIPYQAIIALENCDIHELLSWDINVSIKSIKIKVEWSTAKNNGSIKLPKAVYNSIASYNLTQPTWSSSFNNQTLSFKVEWKIADPKENTNSTPNQVPATAYSSRLYGPPPGFLPNTPNYKHNDSGYGSPLTYTSTPAARLFSPYMRHDVYRTPPQILLLSLNLLLKPLVHLSNPPVTLKVLLLILLYPPTLITNLTYQSLQLLIPSSIPLHPHPQIFLLPNMMPLMIPSMVLLTNQMSLMSMIPPVIPLISMFMIPPIHQSL